MKEVPNLRQKGLKRSVETVLLWSSVYRKSAYVYYSKLAIYLPLNRIFRKSAIRSRPTEFQSKSSSLRKKSSSGLTGNELLNENDVNQVVTTVFRPRVQLLVPGIWQKILEPSLNMANVYRMSSCQDHRDLELQIKPCLRKHCCQTGIESKDVEFILI